MRPVSLLILFAVIALSACAKSDHDVRTVEKTPETSNGNAVTLPGPPPFPEAQSATNGSSAMSGVTTAWPLQAGLWETTFTMNSAKGVNMSSAATGGAADSSGNLRLRTGPSHKTRMCITAQDVADGAPAMMSGNTFGSCRWDKFDITPGAVSGTLLCSPMANSSALRAEVTGALMPNLFGTQLHLTIGDPAGTPVVVEAMMQGQRLGDCGMGSER